MVYMYKVFKNQLDSERERKRKRGRERRENIVCLV